MPTPVGEDFCNKGGKFGPHNLHENRPGSFQSEDLIFATYHNAGVRAFDIGNAHEPKEVAYYVPDAPERIVDIRPGAELCGAVDGCVRGGGREIIRDGYQRWIEYFAL